MKQRMRKVSILCTKNEKQGLLQELGGYGLIHVDGPEEHYPVPEEIASQLELLDHIQEVIETAQNRVGEELTETGLDVSFNPKLFKERIDKIEKKIEDLNGLEEELRRHEHNLEPWGNIHWLKLGVLEQFGVKVRFFSLPEKEFKTLKREKDETYQLNKVRDLIYFIVFEHGERIHVSADEVHLPKKSLSIVRKELNETRKQIEESWNELASMSIFLRELNRRREQLKNQASFQIASNKMTALGEEGGIELLNGWFPSEKEEELRASLESANKTFSIGDPEIGDEVPVKLKNQKYSSWFEDITKLYQLPNYREFDLTPFIGFFYPIFFAYCLGDAGYGVILTLISLFAMRKLQKGDRAPAYLGLTLGLSTMVIGTVKSGTFFGIPLIEASEIPVLGYFSKWVFITDDQDFAFNAFNVSLMVGLVQILVGIGLSIMRRAKFMGPGMALQQVGKLIIVVSAVGLFLGSYQQMAPFSGITSLLTYSLIAGVLVMIFFYDLNLSLGARMGNGALGVFFVFTGLLGDVLSYIRLFALGVSSSILGLVVNQIGAPLFEGGIVSVIGGVVFLIIGHGLNFAIALLGSMIHPLRLTFVEFYNNAQFEGGGLEYQPLKK